MEFLAVAGATLGFSLVLVGVFSLGIRLSMTADRAADSGESHRLWRSLALACFIICAFGVLTGIYLIIPYFNH